jgi:hypothetical protein
MLRRIFLMMPIALLFGGTACVRDNTVEVKSPANPAAPEPVIISHLVEYRVTGTVNLCTITASDTQEGMSIITTGLPWFQSFKITQDTFLYLDAISDDFGVVHVQIFVDGKLFREAVANGFNPKLAVSGEFHVGS